MITGGRRLDTQTLSGKLPAVVARRAYPKPVVAVVGKDDLGGRGASTFADVFAVSWYTRGDTATDPVETRRVLRAIAAEIVSSAVAEELSATR